MRLVGPSLNMNKKRHVKLRTHKCFLQVLCPICRPTIEKVKFQRHLKDNTNLELPLKKGGLTFCFKLENNDY